MSEKDNRPCCPECNSNQIISKGVSWLCKNCGRWFNKKYRNVRLNPEDYETIPIYSGKPIILDVLQK